MNRTWGRKIPAPLPAHRMLNRTTAGLPQVVDLREWDGPIKDQGQLGCHDDKTEVLTEAGWIPWPQYRGDALLATVNPLSGFLEYQSPSSLMQYDYDGEMFTIDHKRLDFKLSPNHRMY